MTAHGTCWRCKWFDRDERDADGEGICRRYPPSLAGFEDDAVVETWPGVEFLDWCGEFEEGD